MVQKDYSESEKSAPIRKDKSSKRVIFKSRSDNKKSNLLKGRIVAIISKMILVRGDNNQIYEAHIRGVIDSENTSSSLVAVGDWIQFSETNYTNPKSKLKECRIQKIEKRQNIFSRKAIGREPFEQVIASNIDSVLIMASPMQPDYDIELIDKIRITAKLNGLDAFICINKIDLNPEHNFLEDFEIYKQYNLPIFYISLKNHHNVEELIEFLKNKETLLLGQSGVGKSTFINYLFKEQVQKINQLNEIKTKGMHTTTFIKMFDYKNEFKIIDAPGINEFDIWGLEPRDLKFYFDEFALYQKKCEYIDCSHIHEPNCAVIKAVKKGKIPQMRYKIYTDIYKSLG